MTKTVLMPTRRKAVIYLCFLSLLFYSPLSAGEGKKISSDELRSTLDQMFSNLDRSLVPTGLLIDYAVEYEDLSRYDGNRVNGDNLVDVYNYHRILKTLKSSSLGKNPVAGIERILPSTEKTVQDLSSVRISVTLFDYAQIKSNALSDKLISYEHGKVTCVNPEAYQIRSVFAGCVMDNTKTCNRINFYIPEGFILTNKSIKDIEIDYGNGFVSIKNGSVNASLDQGAHDISIRAILQDGQVFFSHSILRINEKLQTKTISAPHSVHHITGSSYNGIQTAADVTIVRASSNTTGKILRPFIFVEGFDPRILGGMTAETIYNKVFYPNSLNEIFDFIYVDWEESGEYIQANAYTLIEILKYINRNLAPGASQAILVGHSMGGLVSRYALKTMENRNITHNVGAYVSYDSPHLGANVPLGILYGFYGVLDFLDEKDILDAVLDRFTSLDDLLELGQQIAYSTSAQQMLVNYVDPAGYLNRSEHLRWQQELKQLGFPNGDPGKNFKLLAIANRDYTSPTIPANYVNVDLSAGIDTDWFPKIHRLMPFVLGITLQDVIVGLLSALPGPDSVYGEVVLSPGTTSSSKVTHIRIGYEKKFLWLIPISKTLYSLDRYYQGNYLYDIYPSSRYDLAELDMTGQSDFGIPLLFYYDMNYSVSHSIPFVPTSSALAYGDGYSTSPSNFLSQPGPADTPFGSNYYMETDYDYQTHTIFSAHAINWLMQQVSTTIAGPVAGYTGAQYYLAGALSSVTWSSSDNTVATIDSRGILTAKGSGITQITAKSGSSTFSKTVVVGIPRYVLNATHVPDGYQITTECIDSKFNQNIALVNRTLNFHWGVKFPGKSINWMTSDNPALFIPLEDNNVEVFFKVSDRRGNESAVQHVSANAPDIYYVTNNELQMDASGNIYKEDGVKYSYKNGKVYLTRDPSLSSYYQRDLWTITEARVISPFNAPYNITVSRGEIAIKNILPQKEVNLIKSTGSSGASFMYVISLLNPEDKVVQFIPVTVKYK